MNILKRAILFSLVILPIQFIYSQDGVTYVSQDLESWNAVALKYKLNKKVSFDLEQGFRFNTDASLLDQALTELSFNFKPIKSLKFGLGFRYIADRGGNLAFDNDFRLNIDAAYKHRVKDFSFKYRLRYQNRNEIGSSRDDGDYFKNYLRLKGSFKYKINNWKLDPLFTIEGFRDLTKYTGSFDKVRFTLGSAYTLKKLGAINAFYGIEYTLGSSYPKTTYIIGLGYTFTIKRK